MNEEELIEDGGESLSGSSDSETELQQQVEELEKVLSDSPYHYESHVELIQLLRQQGDLDKARQARKNMSDVFPLTESIWLQWFQDELPLTVLPEAALELRMLFEKAVDDYLSVPVWQEYIKFTTERMSLMPEGMEYTREVMERAITACGLHVAKSAVLWEAYLEFETAVLNSLQQMQQNDPSDDSIRTQVETQFDKVDKIFKRCLAVPHIGMETTFQEYQSFSDNAVTEESLPAYVRAKKKLEEYLPFEEKLLSSDPPSLDAYLAYISNSVATKSDPAFINILYQRAIADHSIETKLWCDYLSFLDSNFSKIGSVLLPGYKQSVRNCPWMADYWVGYCRALERNNASHEEVIAVFEKTLVGNLTRGKDQLQVWTAYCDYLRRRVTTPKTPREGAAVGDEDKDGETEDGNLVELRKTFKRARDDLEAYFGKDGDPTDSLARYQASLESSCYGNIEEARRIWDDVMTRHGREAKYWIEYANMERCHGNEAACRKLLQRSVNSASDDPERVCDALLQFEREVGTLESFELAWERCQSQLKRVGERRDKAAEKEVLKREEMKKKKKDEKAQRKKASQSDKPHPPRQQQPSPGGQGSKRKRAVKPSHVFYDDSDGETKPTKRPKVARDDIKKKGNSLNDNPPNQTQVAMETEPVNDVVKVVGPRENRTVFASNLSEEVTEDDLKKKFGECGTIADIRLIKTRRLNRLNTYAYIEFSTPEPVTPALKLDKQDFLGKPMYVSPFKERGDSQPHPSGAVTTETTTGGASHNERSNKATVFVSNLQRTVEQDQLQELFEQCGTIKEVRLIKNRAGRSKGFAYIEFENESSANIAVARLNQHQLAFKRIKVAISDPPKRGGATFTNIPQDGGGFTKPSFVPRRAMDQPPIPSIADTPFARRSKSQISLLPRAVARQSTTNTADSASEPAQSQDTSKAETVKKMSNADFRQLLLKKQ